MCSQMSGSSFQHQHDFVFPSVLFGNGFWGPRLLGDTAQGESRAFGSDPSRSLLVAWQ